jgi:3-oxoacyl-[acyl-carrier protein] reductase
MMEGVSVVINARGEEVLKETFEELSLINENKISMVVADLDTDEGRNKLIESCPDADILINNNSGPPPINFLETDKEDWLKALDTNMLSAIFMIKDLLPGMIDRQFGRIINITSAMVKSPHPLMSLSTSARTGLTAFSKGISKDVAKHNVTINNLLPERFDTDRQVFMTEMLMKNQNISREEARSQIASTIAANRFGQPEEFGATCAFLCSEHAGFISGQNLQLDGGSYNGLI